MHAIILFSCKKVFFFLNKSDQKCANPKTKRRRKKTRIIHCKNLNMIFHSFGFALALPCPALHCLIAFIRHRILPVIFTYNILYTLSQKRTQTFTHKNTHTLSLTRTLAHKHNEINRLRLCMEQRNSLG